MVDRLRSSYEDAAAKPDRSDRFSTHCFLSHWNIEGYRFSHRDDVFKAVLAAAMLMNGKAYQRYCQSLESDPEAMLSFKRDSFLFTAPGLPDRIEALSNATMWDKAAIRHTFNSILALARTPATVSDLPQYDLISIQLRSLLTLLSLVELNQS